MVEEIVSRRDAAEHLAHTRGGVLFIARTFRLRSASNGSLTHHSSRAARFAPILHQRNFSRPFERADKLRGVRAKPHRRSRQVFSRQTPRFQLCAGGPSLLFRRAISCLRRSRAAMPPKKWQEKMEVRRIAQSTLQSVTRSLPEAFRRRPQYVRPQGFPTPPPRREENADSASTLRVHAQSCGRNSESAASRPRVRLCPPHEPFAARCAR